MAASGNKKPSKKQVTGEVWADGEYNVVEGRLTRPVGRPSGTAHLFQYVAEKLPFECLDAIKAKMNAEADHLEGVYLAHDSMGVARYGGRGQIFARLQSHKAKYPKQLLYFSFYVIANKNHEREIETALLRAAGAQFTLNKRKIGNGLEPGNILDYEAGTRFFERQHLRGRRRKALRRRKAGSSVQVAQPEGQLNAH